MTALWACALPSRNSPKRERQGQARHFIVIIYKTQRALSSKFELKAGLHVGQQ